MVSISGINDRNSLCNAEFKVVKNKKNEIKRKKTHSKIYCERCYVIKSLPTHTCTR